MSGWTATAEDVLSLVSVTRRSLLTARDIASRLPLTGQGKATIESVEVALAELIAAGELEAWQRDGKPLVVILSAPRAESLGWTLNGTGREWVDRARHKRCSKLRRDKLRRELNESELGFSLNVIPARERVIDIEAVEDGYGPPAVLLGASQTWHGPEWAATRPCPGCRSDRARHETLKRDPRGRDFARVVGLRFCLLCSARVGEHQLDRRRHHVARKDRSATNPTRRKGSKKISKKRC